MNEKCKLPYATSSPVVMAAGEDLIYSIQDKLYSDAEGRGRTYSAEILKGCFRAVIVSS